MNLKRDLKNPSAECEADLKNKAADTPAMRQYRAFKKQHPECVLFFRMGDFYEVFFDDAILCHKVLGITLTERTRGVPMAGVPYHAVENYLRRMIEQGYRVALADQIQDPKEAKGVVDRAVTRVVTAGTLVDETLLDESHANHVAAICFTGSGENSPAVLAVAELSTGRFRLYDLADPSSIIDDLQRIGIDELLYADTATGSPPERMTRLHQALKPNPSLTPRPSWHFRMRDALEALKEHYRVTTLAGFGLSEDDPAIAAAGALLRYFLETQSQHSYETSAEDDHGSAGSALTTSQTTGGRLAHLEPPRREQLADYLILDQSTLRSLEIERTMRDGSADGSLISLFRFCRTPMGRRLLRHWLCFPLRDAARIQARQRAVAALVEDRRSAEELAQMMAGIQDVARMSARIVMKRATPRDLVGLGRSLKSHEPLETHLSAIEAFRAAARQLSDMRHDLHPLAASIIDSCIENPPGHLREGGLIRDGVDVELDEARSLQKDAASWLANYQKQLIDATGIASLKVGFNRVFGYYIEVTAVNAGKVPDAFTRKQTLKNAERYITPELKEFETRVLNAESRAIQREQTLFLGLCAQAADRHQRLSDFADLVAQLDVLACFAEVAVRCRYVRPDLCDEPVIDIRAGRHPVLDQLLQDRFVPNDCTLGTGAGGERERSSNQSSGNVSGPTLSLITGPNMAGKSTFIRQVALITLLAHTGSFVPAQSARIGLTDRIFTRIGASDELHAGRSTFMVEMTETANILHHVGPKSLVILDEIGRGTSTLDGLSLAWAIAEHLAATGARTLFATHYHELTEIARVMPEVVKNLHVAVREWHDDIIFIYRILPGRTDRSYGIHVARIAGVPKQVIDRANAILNTLEVKTQQESAQIESKIVQPSLSPPQTPITTMNRADHLSLWEEEEEKEEVSGKAPM